MSFSVRAASAVGLTVVLVGVNVAQVSRRPAQPTPQDTHPEVAVWRPSKVTALKVAQQTDAHIAALRKFECEAQMLVAMPGRKGTGEMKVISRVQDGKTYSIQFPGLSFTKRNEIRKIRVRADGRISELLEPNLSGAKYTPAGKMKIVKNASTADWAMNHPGYIFGPILGETPFTNLVRQASKPGSGYKVSVTERVVRRLNKPYPQFRISILRIPNAAKKLGDLQLEAVVDGTQWLPTTIFAASNPPGREKIQVGNRIAWRVRRKPFDPKIFRLKKVNVPGAPAPKS